MATRSSLEWTEQTWNPVTGCTKVSPGCKHCYAETMARRLKAMGCPGYERGFRLTLHPRRLAEPLARKRPTVYFVNSMSDLFHEDVPEDFLDQVFQVMASTPRHAYRILTKRSARLRAYCQARSVPPNVWLGVSVENRAHGVPRLADLQTVPARVRFLSVEPLLEDLGAIDLTGIHWIILGGESGPKARPMRPEWAERIRRQTEAAGALFFFTQWGTWGPDGTRRSKKANGRMLGSRTYDDRPALRPVRGQGLFATT